MTRSGLVMGNLRIAPSIELGGAKLRRGRRFTQVGRPLRCQRAEGRPWRLAPVAELPQQTIRQAVEHLALLGQEEPAGDQEADAAQQPRAGEVRQGEQYDCQVGHVVAEVPPSHIPLLPEGKATTALFRTGEHIIIITKSQ